jgi:hypothetical protein
MAGRSVMAHYSAATDPIKRDEEGGDRAYGNGNRDDRDCDGEK